MYLLFKQIHKYSEDFNKIQYWLIHSISDKLYSIAYLMYALNLQYIHVWSRYLENQNV